MEVFATTDRFILREIVPADAPGLFALDSDPEVHRYLGNQPVQSMQDVEKIIAYIRQQYQDNGIGRWAVIDKASGEFIGWTGLKFETVVRPEYPYYDLGYRFRKAYWGKGIATETALASLAYGFHNLQLDQICAAAHVDNHGSNRVLTKVGMQRSGQFEFDGDLHNWYVLDRQDYLAANAAQQ